MDTLKAVENFMFDQIGVGFGKQTLAPDENLMDLGIIDSLGIIKVVIFLEDNFQISVEDSEIVPDNFDCLNSIANFVARKKGACAC